MIATTPTNWNGCALTPVDRKRHYLIRAIPYQDPQQEAERLKAVHKARVKIVPRV